MTRKILFVSLFIPILLVTCPVSAGLLDRGDYRYREDVEDFIRDLAVRSDYNEAELVEIFSGVRHQRHLFERMDKPAEKLEWYQYRKIFLTEKRIKRGVEFWSRHRELLQQVEAKYNVPAAIIVAIVGVETFYGAYKGKSPVFDTLVTFAFDYPKRAKFFTRELEEFLMLAREQNLDLRGINGSYAGAMGMPQFISSSYRAYAVDFDGDGQINLFDSLPDVLGSVANYFKRHGWRDAEPVVFPARVADENRLTAFKTSLKPKYDWSQLSQAGVTTEADLKPDTDITLLRLKQKDSTEFWAGLHNFYVITRYNHSELYAMAVYQLSQQIEKRIQ